MASWTSASLSIPAAEELNAVQEALLGFVQQFLSINQDVIIPLLELLATFQSRQDLVATAAATALDAAARLLDDFIKDSAGHLLVVNPLKPFGRAVSAPNFQVTDLGYLPIQQIIRRPADTLIGDGGNYGMYRKIVESLYDQGDLSRPQMDPEAWVGGFIMVFGSDTYLKLVQGLLRLQDIFGPTIPIPLDGFTIPVPQNLKAKPVTVSNRERVSGIPIITVEGVLGEPQTPPPYAVRLRWEPEPLLKRKPAFGNFEYTLESWSVFVKRGRERILPGETLEDHKVYEFPFIQADVPIVRQVLTTSAYGMVVTDLDPDEIYHIAVAYTVEVTDKETGETETFEPTFSSLSAQRRIALSEQAPVSQFLDSRPPDWIAIASPLAPFPPIRQALANIRAVIEVVRDTFADIDNELRGLISYIERRLQEVESIIAQIADGFGFLDNLFQGLDIGIWLATFEGRGGNPFFVKTLGDLLLDPTTENRPPFDNGDEILAAMVFLTESNTVGAVQDFIAFADLFTTDSGASSGFTVTDINREERPADTADTTTDSVETQTQSLVELGLTDEDPC